MPHACSGGGRRAGSWGAAHHRLLLRLQDKPGHQPGPSSCGPCDGQPHGVFPYMNRQQMCPMPQVLQAPGRPASCPVCSPGPQVGVSDMAAALSRLNYQAGSGVSSVNTIRGLPQQQQLHLLALATAVATAAVQVRRSVCRKWTRGGGKGFWKNKRILTVIMFCLDGHGHTHTCSVPHKC